VDWISYDRRHYFGSLIQDLGATALIITREPATGFLCHWLCCLISLPSASELGIEVLISVFGNFKTDCAIFSRLSDFSQPLQILFQF
jgi:hypothetical protein